jgi:GNAT superfamily N-acetyltransferase
VASDRDVLLLVDRAHRAPLDEVRLEWDPLAYKVPPHVTLVYAEEGSKVQAATVSRVASQMFRTVLRFDKIVISGDKNVWLVADQESSDYVESIRAQLLPGKCNPRVVLGRAKDRLDAEKIRDHALSRLHLPLVMEFGEVLHEEILVDGSSRQIGRFPLRQDQLVFQAGRAARWLWNVWPFEAGSALDVSRTAYRLLNDLVPFEEDRIKDSSWAGVRKPEEPLSVFDAQEITSQGQRALAVLRWSPQAGKRYVEVMAHSLSSGAKARDAEPLVAETARAFAGSGFSAVQLFLWGDRRGDRLPGNLWHLDSVQTLGRIPEEVMFDVPPDLQLVKESNVEFMDTLVALYEEHRREHPRVAERADPDEMRRNLSMGGVLSLRDGDQIIGLVGWQLGQQPNWDVPAHVFNEVIIAPAHRGRGYGKVLRAVATRQLDKRLAEFQAGRIRWYNNPSISGALASGRQIVATSLWIDAGDGDGWPRYGL